PPVAPQAKGFYEKLYLYQSYCWFAFIRLDFLQYYRYCQKWVDLFTSHPEMLAVETASYIKGMHNLMGAHFDLLNHEKLEECIKQFESFAKSKLVKTNDINRILVFYYKIACLYFGSGNNEKAIDYLNRIINQKADLRNDLQCYARLL